MAALCALDDPVVAGSSFLTACGNCMHTRMISSSDFASALITEVLLRTNNRPTIIAETLDW
jgi:hypothetical protein